MKVTFLVGNGFDINAGIKSSYSDFCKWYCKQPSIDDDISDFKHSIKNDLENGGENWSDFERGLGQYTSNFSSSNIQAFIDCYSDARTNLLEYLKMETNKYDYEIDESEIKHFREGLAHYYDELRPKEKRDFESIYPAAIDTDIEIDIISFNYTDILDRFVEAASKTSLKQWVNTRNRRMYLSSSNVLHVHGNMEEFPIFGVNDESQIANKELLSNPVFRSIMIKSESIKEVGALWHEDADKIIMNSQVICIYGMSFGITDSKWFLAVMQWMRKNSDHLLIIYTYSKYPANRISIDRWAKIKAIAKKKMTDYSGFTDKEIENINKRIFVIENTKILFNIRLRKKDQTKNSLDLDALLAST